MPQKPIDPPVDADQGEAETPAAEVIEVDAVELDDTDEIEIGVVVETDDDDDDDDEEEEVVAVVVAAPVVVAPAPRPSPTPGRPPGAREEPPPPFGVGERVILTSNTRPRTGTSIGDYPVGSRGIVETVLSQTAIVRFDRHSDTKEVVAFTCLETAETPERHAELTLLMVEPVRVGDRGPRPPANGTVPPQAAEPKPVEAAVAPAPPKAVAVPAKRAEPRPAAADSTPPHPTVVRPSAATASRTDEPRPLGAAVEGQARRQGSTGAQGEVGGEDCAPGQSRAGGQSQARRQAEAHRQGQAGPKSQDRCQGEAFGRCQTEARSEERSSKNRWAIFGTGLEVRRQRRGKADPKGQGCGAEEARRQGGTSEVRAVSRRQASLRHPGEVRPLQARRRAARALTGSGSPDPGRCLGLFE